MRVERDSQIMRVLELGEIRMALWDRGERLGYLGGSTAAQGTRM